MAVMQATLAAQTAKLAKLEAAEAARAKAIEMENDKRVTDLADLAIAGGYDKAQRQHLIAFARSNYDAAFAAVSALLPKGTRPAHLFERVSRHGGPINSPDASTRDEAGPAKPKVKHAMGRRFVEVDAEYAAEIERVADSKDPVTMAKVDKLLSPAKRAIKFDRLIAAEKIVKAERPDLAYSAE